MINIQQLDYLTDTIHRLGLDSQEAQQQLKLRFSDLRLSFCFEDELGVQRPYRSYEMFNLYLVGSAGHCLHLTDSLEQAQGILIAQLDG